MKMKALSFLLYYTWCDCVSKMCEPVSYGIVAQGKEREGGEWMSIKRGWGRELFNTQRSDKAAAGPVSQLKKLGFAQVKS